MIHVPVERVWSVLLDKIEHPQRYVPGVRESRIVARPGPCAVHREMTVGSGADAVVIRELITWDETSRHVVFKLVDDPQHVGFVVNMVFDHPAGAELDYTLHWTERAGAAVAAARDWHAVVREAVLHTKELAEAAER